MDAVIFISVAVLLVATVIFSSMWRRHRLKSRAARIRNFVFPASIAGKVKETYPHCSNTDIAKVIEGLREFFHLSLLANGRLVSMPSKAVDVAWHELILFTKLYQDFCHAALGRFLHHTPAEAMRTPTLAQDGIKRAWHLSCKHEGIDSINPSRLPLLFAIDSSLSIPDGYKYSLNCQTHQGNDNSVDYCAAHIGCGGGCAGASSVDSYSGGVGGGGDVGGDGGGGSCGGGGD